jgi:DNA polymerase
VGKQAVLGLGFNMGALKFVNRLRADEKAAPLFDSGQLSPLICRDIVREFRVRYPMIPLLWHELEAAARLIVEGQNSHVGRIDFSREGDLMQLRLPSGRALRYAKLRLENVDRTIRYLDDWGEEAEFTPKEPSLTYGCKEALYGGKLCENLAQAVARDLLVEAILRIEARHCPVIFHVHDEVVVEVEKDRAQEAQGVIEEELSRVPTWAAGLPIGCEVSVKEKYGK